MQQTVTLSQTQAGTFAAAILPFIRDYINANSENREEFEEFRKQRQEKKNSKSPLRPLRG